MSYLSLLRLIFISLILSFNLSAHESWEPTAYSSKDAHAPTPLPDRVVLTWEEDTATTQSVSWRTDTTIKQGMAQLAVANSNGRALKPKSFNSRSKENDNSLLFML